MPATFAVPATLETKEFRLRMLTVNDVVKDYDTVMTSVAHLKTIVSRESPFQKVAYPGRSIDWATWRAIPDEKR